MQKSEDPQELDFKLLNSRVLQEGPIGDAFKTRVRGRAKVNKMGETDIEVVDPTGEVDWIRIYVEINPEKNPGVMDYLREINPKEIYFQGDLKSKHGMMYLYPDKDEGGKLFVRPVA